MALKEFPKFIAYMICFGVVALLMMWSLQSYVDVKIFRNSYIEYGKRVALLNAIGESSDLVMKDSNEQPKKLIFLKEKLNEIPAEKELDCCYYYDYDYFLRIRDFKRSEEWEMGFEDLDYFLKKGKSCKVMDKKQYIGASSIPAVIFDGINYDPGVIYLELGKTPLSNIAYKLSLTCSKTEGFETKADVYGIKTIQIYENDDTKEICIIYDKDNKEKRFCKKIFCDKKIEKKEIYDIDDEVKEKAEEGCYEIPMKLDENKIIVSYLGGINLEVIENANE